MPKSGLLAWRRAEAVGTRGSDGGRPSPSTPERKPEASGPFGHWSSKHCARAQPLALQSAWVDVRNGRKWGGACQSSADLPSRMSRLLGC